MTRVRPAAGARRRPGRRVQAHGRGPRRRRARTMLQGQTDNLDRARPNEQPQASSACSPSSRPTRRSCSWTSNRDRVPDARASTSRDVFDTLQVYLGSLLRQRLQPLRPHLAGDRPGRRRSSATSSRTCKRLKVRNARRRDGPARRRWPTSSEVNGPLVLTRYNMYPAAADQRQRGAGRQLRRGDRADGASSPTQELPPSDGLRVDRAGLPRAAGRQHRR